MATKRIGGVQVDVVRERVGRLEAEKRVRRLTRALRRILHNADAYAVEMMAASQDDRHAEAIGLSLQGFAYVKATAAGALGPKPKPAKRGGR